jgi:hypothetical protein
LPQRAISRRIEHRGGVAGEVSRWDRVPREVALFHAYLTPACGRLGKCGRSPRLTLDRVNGPASGQSESKSAEAGKQIKHRLVSAHPGEHLINEDLFGCQAGLQKSAGWVGYGHAGHQHSCRAALHDKGFVSRRSPYDPGEGGFSSKSCAGFESPQAWRLLSLYQQVDTAVRRGQRYLRASARRQQSRKPLPQLRNNCKERGREHGALRDIDQIVSKALTKPDSWKKMWVAGPHDAQPGPPPRWRNLLQRLDHAGVDSHPFERGPQSREL